MQLNFEEVNIQNKLNTYQENIQSMECTIANWDHTIDNLCISLSTSLQMLLYSASVIRNPSMSCCFSESCDVMHFVRWYRDTSHAMNEGAKKITSLVWRSIENYQ